MPNLGAIGSNASVCEFSYEIDQIWSIHSGAEDNEIYIIIKLASAEVDKSLRVPE